MFIDYVKIHVKAGDGGNGCVSFRREKHVPRGGPNGGDGGDGGDVIFYADNSVTTLLDLHFKQHYKAGRGAHGMGNNMHGRRGKDEEVAVPIGTVLKDAETGEILVDLTENGQKVIVAFGGKGGRGNARFASSTNQAPRHFEKGEPGEERILEIELKLIADVGVVGQPNTGKSTLLSRLSTAHPKIADYPFTTLEPNLGIVRVDEFQSFVMADIPGLIEGAHLGKGLGFQFLRHIERTKVLLFLIDSSRADPLHDLDSLLEELRLFNPALLEKPCLMALTKIDLLDGGERPNLAIEEILGKLSPRAIDLQIPLFAISSVTGEGLSELVFALNKVLKKIKGEGETRREEEKE